MHYVGIRVFGHLLAEVPAFDMLLACRANHKIRFVFVKFTNMSP